MSLDTRPAPDSHGRFTAAAPTYERHRPAYPAALLDFLATTCGLGAGARVVDLGCGTGLSSRFLATRWSTLGVDVNDAMLAAARAAGDGPRLRYVRGSAEDSGLPDGCADLVSLASALHWFDVPRALAEIARLVAPGGWAAAYWFSRARSPFNDELDALLCDFSPAYRRQLGSDESPLRLLREAGVAPVEVSLPDENRVDRAAYLERLAPIARGVDDRDRFDAAVDALFARHAAGGALAIAMSCDVQAWRPR